MADVLHRVTKRLLRSVSTPDYVPAWRKGEPAPLDGDWIVNPDLKAVDGVEPRYWKLDGNTVTAMDDLEKAAVDQAEADAELAAAKASSKAALDDDRVTKALIEVLAPVLGDSAAKILDEVRAKIDAGA